MYTYCIYFKKISFMDFSEKKNPHEMRYDAVYVAHIVTRAYVWDMCIVD